MQVVFPCRYLYMHWVFLAATNDRLGRCGWNEALYALWWMLFIVIIPSHLLTAQRGNWNMLLIAEA